MLKFGKCLFCVCWDECMTLSFVLFMWYWLAYVGPSSHLWDESCWVMLNAPLHGLWIQSVLSLGFLPSLYCGNLARLLEVKLMTPWALPGLVLPTPSPPTSPVSALSLVHTQPPAAHPSDFKLGCPGTGRWRALLMRSCSGEMCTSTWLAPQLGAALCSMVSQFSDESKRSCSFAVGSAFSLWGQDWWLPTPLWAGNQKSSMLFSFSFLEAVTQAPTCWIVHPSLAGVKCQCDHMKHSSLSLWFSLCLESSRRITSLIWWNRFEIHE